MKAETPYTHHLPADTAKDRFLASAAGKRCRLVEDDSTSRETFLIY